MNVIMTIREPTWKRWCTDDRLILVRESIEDLWPIAPHQVPVILGDEQGGSPPSFDNWRLLTMGHEKGKSEGGSGGRRGHSMMDHGSPTAEIKDGARIARRNDDARAVEGFAGTRQSSMPQPTIEYDKDDDMWIATWAKPGGGGVIAEGKSREQALERFRSAWGLWRREAPRGG